jgi:hypothetical protein
MVLFFLFHTKIHNVNFCVKKIENSPPCRRLKYRSGQEPTHRFLTRQMPGQPARFACGSVVRDRSFSQPFAQSANGCEKA